MPLEHGSAEERLAVAIFPETSMLNHACKPNVDLVFMGRKVTVRTNRDISAGEPLRHCYGPQVTDFARPTTKAVVARLPFPTCQKCQRNSRDDCAFSGPSCLKKTRGKRRAHRQMAKLRPIDLLA